MTHTIHDAELAQLRDVLTSSHWTLYPDYLQTKAKDALTLLSEIAARTQEPVARVTSNECISQGDGTWCGIRLESQIPLDEGTKLYLAPQPAAVPDGMVLVPVEPTEEMIDAWWVTDQKKGSSSRDCYAALLAAAPKEAA